MSVDSINGKTGTVLFGYDDLPLYSGNASKDDTFFGILGTPCKLSLSFDFTAVQSSVGNVGCQFFFTNNEGPTGEARFGVGQFVGAQAGSLATDTWANNTGMYLVSGFGPEANAYGIEIDMNNASGNDYGDSLAYWNTTSSQFSLSPLFIYAPYGNGFNRVTAAIMIGSVDGQVYNRGIGFFGDSIRLATIQDDTDSSTVLFARGTHTNGLDFQAATGMAYALKAPAGAGVLLGSVSLAGDTSGYLQVSGGLAMVLQTAFIPGPDNAIGLGSSSNRFSSVYSAGGVITSSDVRLKTDVAAPPPGMLDVVCSIPAITYKDTRPVRLPQEQARVSSVQETTSVEVSGDEVVEIDGRWVLRKVSRMEEHAVFDEKPVFNEDGSPAYIDRQKVGVRSNIGSTQRIKRAPKMVDAEVKEKVYTPIPEQPTLWGWSADEIRRVMSEKGVTFDGVIEEESGELSLRADQLVPSLWKAVQELSSRVDGLQAKMSAI